MARIATPPRPETTHYRWLRVAAAILLVLLVAGALIATLGPQLGVIEISLLLVLSAGAIVLAVRRGLAP